MSRGGHRFSETKYSPLFGHGGTFKEYEQTAKMTGYGLSTAQIADVLERDERTILAWQKALARKCKTFHLSVCSLIGLVLTYLQMDEIWSYCQSKKRQMWVFIALEARTKFWVNFETGSRTARTAERLLKNLIYLMPWGIPNFLLVTTDKLAAYEKAIARIFRKVRYAYLQVVKQRRKHRLVTVKQEIVKGESADFGNKTRNTSYIERFNLTLRRKVAYLHRKTLGYCKSQANLRSCLWINLFDYNYGRFHRSLRIEINAGAVRFRKRYVHQTPAMRMGLTTTRLTWRDLIIAPIPENAHNFGSLTVW
jgi:IS1 family transposase